MSFKNLVIPQKLRDIRNRIPRVENAGWHFSYMGGIDRVILKMHSTADADSMMATRDNVEKCFTEGKDLYGRTGAADFEFEFCSLDELGLPGIDKFVEKYPNFYHSENR